MTDLVNRNQAIFDAIVAATSIFSSGYDTGITINTKAFIKTFNNHRDRALCTSLSVAQAAPEEYPFFQTQDERRRTFGPFAWEAGDVVRAQTMDFRYHGSETENMIRLSASELACYRWPEDTAEHRALRAAFMDGAASVAQASETEK